MNILQNSQVGGGWNNKLVWAKFSKIRILRARSAQKNCSFTMFFGQNPPKTRYFSSKWAFFLICFIIWHLFLIIWQMFPKIIIFALQQIKIFQNHPLSKIRIFWKNIHPWWQVQVTVRWGSNLKSILSLTLVDVLYNILNYIKYQLSSELSILRLVVSLIFQKEFKLDI